MFLLNTVPLIVLVFMNSMLCAVSKRSFGRMLPLSMMLAVYVLFLSQMLFGTFLVGLILCGACAAGGAGLLICRGKREDYRSLVFSNGFWAFLAVFLVFFVMDFGRHLAGWDELMHWGKMVRQMIRLDRFYCVPESTMIWHRDYPPFISLFEYFWCVLSGGFSDMGVLMALHVFELSLIVPVMAEEREMGKIIREKILRGILAVLLFAVLIIYLDRYGTFDKIYTDILIGILFAYVMYLVWSKEAYSGVWGFLTFCLALAAMILVKQIGIAFILAAYFYFAVMGIRKPFRIRSILWGILPLLLCGACYLAWNRLIASYQITGQFELKNLSLNGMLGILKNGGGQLETLKRIVKAIFKNNIVQGFLPVTFASSALLVILFPELLHGADRTVFPRREKNLTVLTLILGTIGYAAVMTVLYSFFFYESDGHEAATLNSFPRYMGSYLTGEMLFLAYIAIRVFGKRVIDRFSNRKLFIVLLAAMVLLIPDGLQKITPRIINEDPMHSYEVIAETITGHTEEGKRVYLAYTVVRGDEKINVAYYADDVYMDPAYMDVLHIDFEKNPALLAEAVDMLKKDDYLYLFEVTETFDRAFSGFNGGQGFTAGSVYLIDTENDELQFRMADARPGGV